MIRCIIPCAGYGTRMDMKPNESKEMLTDPNTGLYMIDYTLDICDTYKMTPLIVTRKEKTDLIKEYSKWSYTVLVIEPYGEWPNTILASQSRWDEYNIMILPDTRFEPLNVIGRIINDLKLGCLSSIALHQVNDSSKWCVVKDYDLIEKPTIDENAWAMGVIGWHKNEGYRLFKALSKRNNPYRLMDTSFQYLDSFKDITRTGKVEQ